LHLFDYFVVVAGVDFDLAAHGIGDLLLRLFHGLQLDGAEGRYVVTLPFGDRTYLSVR
jgi:hypothetical protein